LGKAFRGVLTRFGELQRALTAAPPPTKPDSSSNATQPAPSAAEEVFQQLLRDLSVFEYAQSHARAVQENALAEMGNYERQEVRVESQIQAVLASLTELQAELQQAKQWRSEQEEYEALTHLVQELPSRATTEADIAALDQKHSELLIAQETLQHQLHAKRDRHLGLTRAYDAIRRDWSVVDQSAAGIAARAAAQAAAEAERRRAEEEAAAYEAAQAAKASASAEEEAAADETQDDEKKHKAGLSSTDEKAAAPGEEAEEGAVEEEEEEGAVPADVPAAAASPIAATPASGSGTPRGVSDGSTTAVNAMDTGAAADDADADAAATTPTTSSDAAVGAAAAASSPIDSATDAPGAAGRDSPAPSPVPAQADPEADAAPMET
jgi:hypothetical protein